MQYEQNLRLAFFIGTLSIVALWEIIAPRRMLNESKLKRWATNLILVVINTAVVRFFLPVLPVGLALIIQEQGWGILNIMAMPLWINTLLAFIAFDFIIYLQHMLFHFLPVLWRLHRMHHTDLDFDVTTGNRFHPIEIIISTGIKLAAVVLIGPTAGAVIAFEIVLNSSSQFNHGNIRIPDELDRRLRLIVVTPDMHRVHHSVKPGETNSNFGFNLPWWDRIFGTYRPQPEKGHQLMAIGLKEYRDFAKLSLPYLLIQPFMRKQL